MTARKPKSQHKKSGRPTKFSPETRRKIEEATALDASIKEVCYFAGIHKDTYYEWIKKYPDFSDHLNRLRERPVLKARKTIVDNLDDPKVAMDYLKRKKKNEFSERIESTGAGGKDLIPSEEQRSLSMKALKSFLKK